MNNIEFKKYTHWPNIEKMDIERKKNLGNYDYIAFCFELGMTQEKKITNAYFAGYLFLDFYEQNRKVSFDIPSAEDDSNNFFSYRIDNKKNKVKKKVSFENGHETIIIKPESTSVVYDPSKSYHDLTKQFIETDMKTKFDEIFKFMNKNNISYEKEETELYFKQCLDEAKNFFADKLLKEKSIIATYSEISSIIMYEKMNNDLEINTSKKSIKI